MACEQLPPQQDATAHPCAQREQQHIAESLRSPPPGLAHEGAVAIIRQGDTPLQLRLQPLRQGHLLPARQVDAHPCHAAGGIHRPRQADAHQGRQPIGIQLLHSICQGHRKGTGHGGLGRRHLQLRQQRTLAIEAAELDGGAAQVDADQLAHHGCFASSDPGPGVRRALAFAVEVSKGATTCRLDLVPPLESAMQPLLPGDAPRPGALSGRPSAGGHGRRPWEEVMGRSRGREAPDAQKRKNSCSWLCQRPSVSTEV